MADPMKKSDKELTKAVVDAVFAAGEAIAEARRAGLTVELHEFDAKGLALSVSVSRTTPLFDVGKKVDITQE
jgi:hypothetical protein